jgi:hypothetical protein
LICSRLTAARSGLHSKPKVWLEQVSAKLEKEKQKLAAFAKQAAVQQERRDAKKQRKAKPNIRAPPSA